MQLSPEKILNKAPKKLWLKTLTNRLQTPQSDAAKTAGDFTAAKRLTASPIFVCDAKDRGHGLLEQPRSAKCHAQRDASARPSAAQGEGGERGGCFLRFKMSPDCLSRWLNPVASAGKHGSLPRCRHAFHDDAQHIVHVLPADRDFRGELDAVAQHGQGGALDVVRGDEAPAVERGEGFADFY